MLIDTHFHLDLLDNMQDMAHELRGSEVGIIAVGTTPKAYLFEKQYWCNEKGIKVALGLHPQLIASRKQEIGLFLELLENSVYIGEIGLDFNFSFYSSKEDQIHCFRAIAKACANIGSKILSIHSVKSTSVIINELIKAGVFRNNTCILHWFSGSSSELKMAIEAGAWFSINPKMLYSNLGREVIKAIPNNRILLETDAPFSIKISSASDLQLVLGKLIHEISSIRREDINTQVECNSQKIWNNSAFHD